MVLCVLIPKNAVPFIYIQCVQIGMGGWMGGGDSNTRVYCRVIMCIKWSKLNSVDKQETEKLYLNNSICTSAHNKVNLKGKY
jgi:hypothetical protein